MSKRKQVLNKEAEVRILCTLAKQDYLDLAMTVGPEMHDRVKQKLFARAMRVDRISAPEAMEFVDRLFAPVEQTEKTLAKEFRPRPKKIPRGTHVNGHSRRTHGHSNGHWHGPATMRLEVSSRKITGLEIG